ncbi:MAG TPA: hypothetical protein VF060_00240 [Trebonia sp.]
MSIPKVQQSWRVLGFGKHPENAAAIQAGLRDAGLAATNFALSDDDPADALPAIGRVPGDSAPEH